jgi:hypothetical protein
MSAFISFAVIASILALVLVLPVVVLALLLRPLTASLREAEAAPGSSRRLRPVVTAVEPSLF